MSPERLYSALLYLYPKQFRVEYGEAMVDAFRAARRDTAPARFWSLIAKDLCRSLGQEHMREIEPGLKHLARCTLASVLSTLVLIGSIAGGVAASGRSTRAINEDVHVAGMRTGWFSAGIEIGTNKLVPSIIVRLKNVSKEPIEKVRLIAIFRRVGETKTWGSGAYVPAISSGGLAPDALTIPVVLQSQVGYTGIESREELLRNTQFVDVRVRVLAKRGSAQWQELGEWPVERSLLDKR
jgi:hypothetical protein